MFQKFISTKKPAGVHSQKAKVFSGIYKRKKAAISERNCGLSIL
jgi:hypothetical protein